MAKEYKSKYRSWITDYFEDNAERRIGVQEIHTRMQSEGMNVNLTTVYRNLDRLAEERVLSKEKMPEEDGHFYRYLRPELGCTGHLHLTCRRCGRIIHLNCEFMKEIQEHLNADHGFMLDCGQSMLVGLCRECGAGQREKEETT